MKVRVLRRLSMSLCNMICEQTVSYALYMCNCKTYTLLASSMPSSKSSVIVAVAVKEKRHARKREISAWGDQVIVELGLYSSSKSFSTFDYNLIVCQLAVMWGSRFSTPQQLSLHSVSLAYIRFQLCSSKRTTLLELATLQPSVCQHVGCRCMSDSSLSPICESLEAALISLVNRIKNFICIYSWWFYL